MKQLVLILLMASSMALNAQRPDTAIEVKKDIPVPYGNNPAAGNYYSNRGFHMYYESYGSGQPVLFIHGNGGSISSFTNQLPFFSRNFRVIVADSRCQGKSSDNGDSLSYEMMSDDYDGLLNHLGIDSAYVVGWSDGGIIGLLMAIRHPDKVRKLAITGANLMPDTTAVYGEILDLVRPDFTALKTKAIKSDQDKNSFKLLGLLLEQPHISVSSLQKIKCPALIIGGDHDLIKVEHTLLIYRNIPEADLWILPDSGHSTPVVYKDDFNKNVTNFFLKPYRKIEKEARFY